MLTGGRAACAHSDWSGRHDFEWATAIVLWLVSFLGGCRRCVVAKRMLMLILFAAVVMPMSAQSTQSLRGVWRAVEITITDSPAGRRDPFGAFAAGTHTRFQPSLMIFTGRHYSRTTTLQRSLVPRRLTRHRANRRWKNYRLNGVRSPPTRARTKVSDTTVTLHAIVAKNPRAQSKKNFTKLTFKLDGDYVVADANRDGRRDRSQIR